MKGSCRDVTSDSWLELSANFPLKHKAGWYLAANDCLQWEWPCGAAHLAPFPTPQPSTQCKRQSDSEPLPLIRGSHMFEKGSADEHMLYNSIDLSFNTVNDMWISSMLLSDIFMHTWTQSSGAQRPRCGTTRKSALHSDMWHMTNSVTPIITYYRTVHLVSAVWIPTSVQHHAWPTYL